MIETHSPETAEKLRKAVMQEFAELRPWVCVIVEGKLKRRIEVTGYWGAPLPEGEAKKVQKFLRERLTQV